MPEIVFWGNPLQLWLYFGVTAVALAVVLWLARKVLTSLLKDIGEEGYRGYAQALLRSMVRKTNMLSIIAVSLLAGLQWVEVVERVAQWNYALLLIIIIIQAGLWLNACIAFWLRRTERKYRTDDPGKLTTLRAMGTVAKIFVIAIVSILALDQVPGVEVTALVAGLGIGGIAVALALQNILADLFASLSISLDKPFAIGDFVIIGDFLGSVEKIGLKTTRIASLSGEQLIFSNSDLLNSRIRNYKRMRERRVLFTVGVTYETSRERLLEIPGIFKEVLGRQENVRFDRAHFKGYGAYSLNFEFVYYVLSPDYNLYMDIQQAINFGLHEEFEKRSIEFAYPTQMLYLSGLGGVPTDNRLSG